MLFLVKKEINCHKIIGKLSERTIPTKEVVEVVVKQEFDKSIQNNLYYNIVLRSKTRSGVTYYAVLSNTEAGERFEDHLVELDHKVYEVLYKPF